MRYTTFMISVIVLSLCRETLSSSAECSAAAAGALCGKDQGCRNESSGAYGYTTSCYCLSNPTIAAPARITNTAACLKPKFHVQAGLSMLVLVVCNVVFILQCRHLDKKKSRRERDLKYGKSRPDKDGVANADLPHTVTWGDQGELEMTPSLETHTLPQDTSPLPLQEATPAAVVHLDRQEKEKEKDKEKEKEKDLDTSDSPAAQPLKAPIPVPALAASASVISTVSGPRTPHSTVLPSPLIASVPPPPSGHARTSSSITLQRDVSPNPSCAGETDTAVD